jgi:hypothetical protein
VLFGSAGLFAMEPRHRACNSVAHAYNYDAQLSRLAHDEEAAQLRAIRARLLAGDIGPTYYRFIPVQDGEGRLYKLYARDTIPIENEQGCGLPSDPGRQARFRGFVAR